MKLALAIVIALTASAHANTCKVDALAAGRAVKLAPVGLAGLVHDTSAKSVWTGRYFVIVHGYPPLDAHVYDACTDTWAAAPPWPDDTHYQGSYVTAAWSGSRVIITLPVNVPMGELDPATLEWHPSGDDSRKALPAEWIWFDHSYQHLHIREPVGGKTDKHELSNPPDGRHNHAEARDGDRVIVWGGRNKDDSERDDGVILDLAHDTWKPISSKHAPSARLVEHATWVHGKLVVWGGLHSDGKDLKCLTDGAIYDPATDIWTPIDPTDAPSARHEAIEMVAGDLLGVFGGHKCYSSEDKAFADAAVLDVAHAKWRKVKLPGPVASAGVSVVEGYAIAGGKFFIASRGQAFVYDPKANAVRALPAAISTKAEWRLRGVTDTTLVLWGKRTEVRPGMPCGRQAPNMPHCDPMPGVYSESDEGWIYRF